MVSSEDEGGSETAGGGGGGGSSFLFGVIIKIACSTVAWSAEA